MSLFYGTFRDDMLSGTPDGETLIGGAGDDTVDGGSGADVAQYSGTQAAYSVRIESGNIKIVDRRVDGDGSDLLSNVEMLRFGVDESFDLEKFAGTASLSEKNFESLIELYIAYFNRAPDAVGLNFWGTAFANGMSLDEIAAQFAPQPETVATYPEGTSNTEFVTTVYNNVLGRGPDQGGLEFWVSGLEVGGLTRDTFILNLLGGVQEGNSDREYLDNKVDIGAYFAVHKGMSDSANAKATMALYDGTESSIAQAVNAINEYYQGALDPENGEFLLQVVGILYPYVEPVDLSIDSVNPMQILSNKGTEVEVQGTATGATIEIDNITTDRLNAYVIATGVEALEDMLTFNFVDGEDLVILSSESVISGFSLIRVVSGSVDFTALGENALDGVTLQIGSGAIVTAKQALSLTALELRAGATDGKLEIDLSGAVLTEELLDNLRKFNSTNGVEVSVKSAEVLSANQLKVLGDAGIVVGENAEDGSIANEAPTGSVTIIGTTTQGEVLTANISTLTDANALGTLNHADGDSDGTVEAVQSSVTSAITDLDDVSVNEVVTVGIDDPVSDIDATLVDGRELNPTFTPIRLQGMEGLLQDRYPQISEMNSQDIFMVTWQGETLNGYDIFVQPFKLIDLGDGVENIEAVGTISRLEGSTAGPMDQAPKVSALAEGGFVIVWQGNSENSQEWDIFVQRFDDEGEILGEVSNLRGALGMLPDQAPQVGPLLDGGFVVTWEGLTSDGQSSDIFVQQFNKEGMKDGGTTRLQGMPGNLGDVSPKVSAFSNGGFVVTWEGSTSDSQGKDIFVQRFGAEGLQQDDTIRLQGMPGNLIDWQPQISALSNNYFAITWTGNTSASQGWDIFVQLFDDKGDTVGVLNRLQGMSGDFRDYNPQISALTEGKFVVVWQGSTSDGQGFDIFIQQFSKEGVKDGETISLEKMESIASLSEDQLFATIKGLPVGGTINIADSDADEYDPVTIIATGIDAVGDTLTFNFVDENDVIKLSQDSVIADFSTVQIVNGTVDFTALPQDMLAGITIRGSDADVTEEHPKSIEGSIGDWHPQVSALDNGKFAVTWSGGTSDGQNYDIFTSTFDETGITDMMPNSSTGNSEVDNFAERLYGFEGDIYDWAPQLVGLSGDQRVLTWHGGTDDGQGRDIFVQFLM